MDGYDTINATRGTMAVDYAVFPRIHTLVKETDDRIVLCHVGFPRHFNALQLGKAVAIGNDRLQGHNRFIDDSFPLGVHLVEEQFVLLVLGDGVGAVHSHDAIIDPFPIVTSELGQTVHAEPQETAVGELESLLTFELGEQAVPSRDFIEGLEFFHRQETHVGTSCQPCAVNRSRAETRLNLRQINADVVPNTQEPLHKALQL